MMTDKLNTISRVQAKWLALGILWLFLPLWIHSCVTSAPASKSGDDAYDRIMAENSQMKKRLPLIERENDVLQQENLQYKAKVQQLEATIEKLNADMVAMGEKYEMDMALNEEQFRSLQEKFGLYEKESIQTIQELNKLHDELIAKRNQELKSFNEKIAAQLTSFNQERDKLKQDYASMELTLSSKINELNDAIKDRDTQIASLKTANEEISQGLENALIQLAQTRKKLEKVQKDIESEKAANAKTSERSSTSPSEQAPKPQTP